MSALLVVMILTSTENGIFATQPDPLRLPETPKELGLQSSADLRHLIEQEGSPRLNSNLPSFDLMAPGASLFIAEQLAFQEVSGSAAQFTAVKGDPALLAALVDMAGKQLLACSCSHPELKTGAVLTAPPSPVPWLQHRWAPGQDRTRAGSSPRKHARWTLVE